MKASVYINYLVTGDCSNLAVSDVGDMDVNPDVSPSAVQTANQAKFISYLNLANLALHKRFNLLQKEIELDNPVDGEEFTLPSNFLAPIEAYYQIDFDPVNIKDKHVKLVSEVDTAVSILIPEAFKAVIKGTDSKARSPIVFKYAAAPVAATQAWSLINISQVYTEALLNYAAYKAHAAINGGIQEENNAYYLRYEASCKQIVTSGMWNNNEMEFNNKLEDNGFV